MAGYGDNPKQVLETAKKRYKLALAAEVNQRLREKAALRFQIAEGQWDEEARMFRGGQGGAAEKRPMLSIPKLRQPLNLIRGQYRSSHMGINIHPRSARSSKETAAVLQDLIRTIEQDGEDGETAANVRYWAMDRATQCGSGAYRIRSVYDRSTDDPNDQKLVYERIYDQFNVLWDPAAQRADKSDGRYAFLSRWMPVDEFKQRYPKAKGNYTDGQAFRSMTVEQPQWAQGSISGDDAAVLVVEYFCKYGDPDDPENQETAVVIHKLTSAEVLENDPWPGKKYIPLIPTLGEELQPFDGERRRVGLVEPAMDAAKGYNYAVSQAIETVALEPKAPVVGFEGQFEGHEAKWGTVNTRNWSYLEVKPTTLNGQVIATLPQRMQADTSKMGMAVQLAQQFDNDIQSATNITDAALGKFESRRQSGKAIEALQDQSNASSSGFIQNMGDISVPLDARILLDAIPVVYDRPGRIAQVIDAEKRPRAVMLNAPFVVDQATGMPQEARQGEQGAKTYDLSDASIAYGVTVTVGKSYQSQQQQGQEQLGQLIAADPSLNMVWGDIYARFLDVPGANEIADRMLTIIEQHNPGLTKKQGEPPNAAQIAAQMKAKDEQVKKLEGMLSQATHAIETDQAKQQSNLQKAQMGAQASAQKGQTDAEVKLLIAKMDNDTKLKIAELDASTKVTNQKLDSIMEYLKLQHGERSEAMGVMHEAAQADADREHEMAMGRAGAGMQADEAETAREHEADQATESREYDAEQADADRAVSQGDGSGE